MTCGEAWRVARWNYRKETDILTLRRNFLVNGHVSIVQEFTNLHLMFQGRSPRIDPARIASSTCAGSKVYGSIRAIPGRAIPHARYLVEQRTPQPFSNWPIFLLNAGREINRFCRRRLKISHFAGRKFRIPEPSVPASSRADTNPAFRRCLGQTHWRATAAHGPPGTTIESSAARGRVDIVDRLAGAANVQLACFRGLICRSKRSGSSLVARSSRIYPDLHV